VLPCVAPDPKDCHNPVCGSKSAMFFKTMGGDKGQFSSGPVPATETNDANNVTSRESFVASGCPVDREELGRQSWTLLHTMAAYYPDDPTETDKTNMMHFLTCLAHFYPCSHCAEAFRETLIKHPPQVQSRKELSLWMCLAHNEVNRELGKPTVDCKIESLDERWRTGRKECWPEGESADEL